MKLVLGSLIIGFSQKAEMVGLDFVLDKFFGGIFFAVFIVGVFRPARQLAFFVDYGVFNHLVAVIFQCDFTIVVEVFRLVFIL